jgi:O-antigen/teichoic acid export membrane protein
MLRARGYRDWSLHGAHTKPLKNLVIPQVPTSPQSAELAKTVGDKKLEDSLKSPKPTWLPVYLRQMLARRADLHAVLANSSWLLFDKLIRLLLGLLVGVWVTRYLGPSQFGELAYILAYLAFFQAIATLGADAIIVRDIARDREMAPQILGTAFILRLAAGLLCWLTAVGAMTLMSGAGDISVVLTALAGGTLVFQSADVVDLWFQSQSQSRRTVVAKLIGCLISNGLRVALILASAPLLAFVAVIAVEALVSALALAAVYRFFPVSGRWQTVRDLGFRLLRESWPFMLSGISIMVYMRIDQIMLKQMLGEGALGIYAAGLRLSEVWHFIPIVLATSFAPFISRKKAEGPADYHKAMVEVFRIFGGLAIAISICTALASKMLVEIFYGDAFALASSVLAIQVFSNLFIFQGVAQGIWLANESAGRIALIKTLIGSVVAVVGNIILIPKMGLIGCAIVSVLAQGTSAVFSNIIFAPKIMLMQFGIDPTNSQK